MTKQIKTIEDLRPDEHNANKGTVRGRAMIEQSIRECGAGRSIVVDREGRVIGGNKTLDVVEELGIPVQVVPTDGQTLVVVQRTDLDLEADPRARRLAYLDNRTTDVDLAWDADVLAEDLASGLDLTGLFDERELADILKDSNPSEDADEPVTPEYPYVPNARFPSDNAWDVPTLDPKLQALQVELPFDTWGSKAGGRKRKMDGTYHFYTDDSRFEALWTDPMPLVLSGCTAAVEPNFSTTMVSPRAFALWNVYRKRWIARYWQSEGVRVFVDLNVPTEYADLLFLGVPHEWRAYMTRGQTAFMESTINEWRAACEHHGSEDINFTVYGGGKQVKQMCSERGWGWLPEERDWVKGKIDG